MINPDRIKELDNIIFAGPPRTKEQVNALIEAIWLVTHDNEIAEGDMLRNLSLLAVVACAMLHEYAEAL